MAINLSRIALPALLAIAASVPAMAGDADIPISELDGSSKMDWSTFKLPGAVYPKEGFGPGGWYKGPVNKKLYDRQHPKPNGVGIRAGGYNGALAGGARGRYELLYIRTRFPDDMREQITEIGANNLMEIVNRWFVDASYNTFSITTTVTPVLTMPYPMRYYDTYNPVHDAAVPMSGLDAFTADADTAAAVAGYSGGFDLRSIRLSGLTTWPFGGLGGGGRTWYKTDGIGLYVHELGHAIGLPHANFWDTAGRSIFGATDAIFQNYRYCIENIEYGDPWDVMGSGLNRPGHFNVLFKNSLGWLTEDHVLDITESTTFRMHAFDVDRLDSGKIYAARMSKHPGEFTDPQFWFGYRNRKINPTGNNAPFPQYANVDFMPHSLQVHINAADFYTQKNGNDNSRAPNEVLLDVTPGTPPGQNDGGVAVGRTFSDPAGNFHVTVVDEVNSEPNALDVVVKRGDFTSNRPPMVSIEPVGATWTPGKPLLVTYPYSATTQIAADFSDLVKFKATASDPDGDALAYYWEFGDWKFASKNSDQISYAYPKSSVPLITPGNGNVLIYDPAQKGPRGQLFTVRCTVTDMKGGIAIAEFPVNVGMKEFPAFDAADTGGRFRTNIRGRILDQAGKPVVGVRVTAQGPITVYAYSDSDGYYLLSGLIPNQGYVFSPVKEGFNFNGKDNAQALTDSVASSSPITVPARRDLNDFNLIARKRHEVYIDTLAATWNDANLNGQVDGGEVTPILTDGKVTIIDQIAEPATGKVPVIFRVRREGPAKHVKSYDRDYEITEDFKDNWLCVRLYTGGGTATKDDVDYDLWTTFLDMPFRLSQPTFIGGVRQPTNHSEFKTYSGRPPLLNDTNPNVESGTVTVVNPEKPTAIRTHDSFPARGAPPDYATGNQADRYVVIRGTINLPGIGISSRPDGSFVYPETNGLGETYTDIVAVVNADSVAENPETISIMIPHSPDYFAAKCVASVKVISHPSNGLVPTPTVSAAGGSAYESGSSNGQFVFYRSAAGDITQSLTVHFALSGTAVYGKDYSIPLTPPVTFDSVNSRYTGSIVIPAGIASVKLPVYAIPDNVRDPNEVVSLTILDGTGYVAGSGAQIVIVEDDLPQVWVVNTGGIARESVLANASGTPGAPANGQFSIIRFGSLDEDLPVKVKFSGSATYLDDYTPQVTEVSNLKSTTRTLTETNDFVTIAAGDTTVVVTIKPVNDATAAEGDEFVNVTIEKSSTYNTVNPALADLVIQDSSLPDVTLSITPGFGTNLNENQQTKLRFQRYRGNINNSLLIRYLVSGSADNGYDYTIDTGSVGFGEALIPDGQTITDISFNVAEDIIREDPELISIILIPQSTYNVDLASDDAQLAIVANDFNGQKNHSFKFDKQTIKVVESNGTADFFVDVVLSSSPAGNNVYAPLDGTRSQNNKNQQIWVGWEVIQNPTSDVNDATGTTDFVLANGVMIFAPQEDMQNGNPSWDRNSPPDSPTLSDGSPYNVYGFHGLNPRPPIDYIRRSLWFHVVGDTDPERDDSIAKTGDETFLIRLSERATGQPLVSGLPVAGDIWGVAPTPAVSNAEPLTECRVTIINDDSSVISLSSDSTTLPEGNQAHLTLTRTGNTQGDATVTFEISGSASPFGDYTITGATRVLRKEAENSLLYTVTFVGDRIDPVTSALIPGETSKTVTLDVALDQTVERAETIAVRLLNGLYNLPGRSAGAGGIGPDDTGISHPVIYPDVDGLSWNPLVQKETLTTGAKINPSASFVSLDITDSNLTDPAEQGTLPIVSVTVEDGVGSEPDRGLGNIIFKLSRTGDTTSSLTVPIQISKMSTATVTGTKDGDIDFERPPVSLTFAPGTSDVTVMVRVVDDTKLEDTETVILGIVPTEQFRAGDPAGAIAYIIDDESPPAVITIKAVKDSTSETSTDQLVYEVRRSRDFVAPLDVIIQITGTASAGVDYLVSTVPTLSPVTLPGVTGTFSLTIPAAQETTLITANPVEDVTAEGDESVTIALLPDINTTNPNYVVGPINQSSAVGVIIDDDAPSVYVSRTADANEEGQVPGYFAVKRSLITNTGLAVNLTWSGTAASGDYVSVPSVVTIPADQSEVTVGIIPVNDAEMEIDETVIVTIATGSGYTVGGVDGSETATLLILDNDRPRLSVGINRPIGYEVLDGSSPPTVGIAEFVISRTASSEGLALATEVKFSLSGTAVDGADYVRIVPTNSVIGTVTFSASAADVYVPITPIDDELVENDETVILTLAEDVNSYNLTTDPKKRTAEVVIKSDDLVRVSVAAVPKYLVKTGCNVPATFVFTRTGSTDGRLRVEFVVDDLAGPPSTLPISQLAQKLIDYRFKVPGGVTSTVDFNDGSDTATVEVEAISDLTEKQIWLKVKDRADGSYLPKVGKEKTFITLLPAGTPYVTISAASDNTTAEGIDTGKFVISRTGSFNNPITVNLGWSGTGKIDDDYTVSLGGTVQVGLPPFVTIPASFGFVDVVVTAVTDQIVEGDETIICTLLDSTANDPVTGKPLYYQACSVKDTVTITDVPPPRPRIVSEPVIFVQQGSALSYQVQTVVAGGLPGLPAPKYYLEPSQIDLPIPLGMTIDSGTGLLSWSAVTGTGHLRVRVRTENVPNNSDSQDLLIFIVPPPTSPN